MGRLDNLRRVRVDPTRRIGGQPFLFVDVLAPSLVVAYLILTFQPFNRLVLLPGFASSVLLPVAAIGVLAVTPVDRLARIPVSFALLACVLWFLLSRLWSVNPEATDFVIRSELPAIVLTTMLAGTMPPKRLSSVLVGTFVTITALSLFASIVLPSSRSVVLEAGASESQSGFRGFFGHKNHLGIFAVLGLAMALTLVRKRRVLHVLLFAATVLGTRSATAGSGMFLTIFVWLWAQGLRRQSSPRRRTVLFMVSLASAVVGVLLALRLLPTLLGIYQKDITFSGRTLIWRYSIELIGTRPLTGFGLGALFAHEPPAQTVALRRQIGFDAAHAHNGIIGVLLDTGLIGGLLVLALLAHLVVTAARVAPRSGSGDSAGWALLTVVGLVIMSISEPVFAAPTFGMLALVLTTLMRFDQATSINRAMHAIGLEGQTASTADSHVRAAALHSSGT